MSFFRKKGLVVQPFKVGPDYIDPGFHHRVCHPRKSRNLDRFFLSEDYLRDCFERNVKGAELALVEGVMGLFDGRAPLSEEGSTAEMAKLLGLPVFLVIDGAGLARSAAALVKGYKSFDPNLDLRGIFVNRVGSEGHFRWLRESIESEIGIPVLGWLPQEPEITIPERHLGLRTAAEEESIEEKLNWLGELLNDRFDWRRFLELATSGGVTMGARLTTQPSTGNNASGTRCRIGVAYDKAFSFYYEDNFDLLRETGADLIFFSPLLENKLPPDLDALYFGGGCPEIYATQLSENEAMKESIRKFHIEGGHIYAECGGLIYLALIGLIPGEVRMTKRLQNFGYHEIECSASTFLFSKGAKLRSHEFHYSIWDTGAEDFLRPYSIQGREEGFYNGHLLASYQHLHFGQDPSLARNFVQAAMARRKQHVHCG